MIDHASLLRDLKGQVSVLEEDLRERSEDPQAVNERTGKIFEEELKVEYHRAFQAERTADTYGAWRDERITQAAVAWVLATVFVRFCEDNRLLEQPFITGPRDDANRYDIAQELKDAWILAERERDPEAPERTDRDWLVHAFDQMSVSAVMAGLFDRAHNPMWTITPSHQAAKNLITFWRRVGDDGHLVHDFTDDTWNTRFLGDLYQDLSEAAKKSYALLQTPEFVEEFILDYTLEPAIKEFGLDGNRIYQAKSKGFRLIDPTCGSGHFLLGAFHRLLEKWRDEEPGVSDWDLIARSLRSVHGVDKNPFAVAIARFRLLIAAMKQGGITTLSAGNPDWPIVVATGDSLIHGRGAPGRKTSLFDEEEVHRYATEDVYDYAKYDLLGTGSYHAVVGNPPYITVKDKQENQNYRDRYATCSGTYALSVPFAERFFDLAKRAGGDRVGAGFVGQITANSFMKREFGKKLIQEFFRDEVRLTHIIDTSGAYIPGHGTPTVILIGQNMKNSHKASVRAVLGIRGEPSQPENPAEGLVWSAIVDQVKRPGSESEWVSVDDLPWESFKDHPWSLGGGGAAELQEEIEKSGQKTSELIYRIGFIGMTHADEAMQMNSGQWMRIAGDSALFSPISSGEDIRDWGEDSLDSIFFPYDGDRNLLDLDVLSIAKYLWRFRSTLGNRATFGGNTYFGQGRPWYEWHQLPRDEKAHKWSITFAFVATHNHFVLDRGGKVFKQSAPVIKLPADATEDQHLELLGVLNSSTACFWLKQVSQSKGNGGIGGGISDELWEHRYEFTGTKLQEFPLPSTFPLSRAKELDSLAQRLSALEPSAVAEAATPTRFRLNDAHAEYTTTRSRMIALQEELDWDVYHRYGLITDAEHAELVVPDTADVPGINLGERAFEIVLARKMAAGEASTEWFNRHGSTPITEVPSRWSEDYKKVVERRIEVIESRKDIALIERPECKRRWQAEPWEKKEKAALKSWLLDRCEDRDLWFRVDDQGESRPHALSILGLGNRLRDLHPEVVEVAGLYDPDKDFADVVAEIVATEHVPYLAALRYKESGLRKRKEWEHVWDLQREEDALNADRAEGEPEKRLSPPIPVPPKYTSADFRTTAYWANRGKLDVPKERFVSYPGAETEQDTSLVLGWAGWNHAEQAEALATLAIDRAEEHDWAGEKEKMTPLLAGIAELMPWVRQWHSDPDEYGQSMADYITQDLEELMNDTGVTPSDMEAWRPAAPTRGRRTKG
ncbi:MAG: BREX-2 system adenine-specific DNA-methyltransferase PglX [Nocardiopsaceae bacterium]|nr:BREX-2 system adenine-specific DNA-methyltransferase PglX [Nocardiopsaceae bacterium]